MNLNITMEIWGFPEVQALGKHEKKEKQTRTTFLRFQVVFGHAAHKTYKILPLCAPKGARWSLKNPKQIQGIKKACKSTPRTSEWIPEISKKLSENEPKVTPEHSKNVVWKRLSILLQHCETI